MESKSKRSWFRPWFILLALLPGAIWYRLQWQSTQHRYQLSVTPPQFTEAQRVEFGKPMILDTGMESRYPDNRFKIKFPADVKLPRGKYIEGPRTNFRFSQVEERDSPTGAWRSASVQDWNKENSVACNTGTSGQLAKPWLPTPTPSSPDEHRLDLECVPNVRPGNPNRPYAEWRVQGTAEVFYFDPATGEEWRASAPLQANFIFRRAFTSKADLNPVTFDPTQHSSLLRSVQYAFALNGPWRNAPRPGENGYPLKAPSLSVIGFRATKSNPAQAWPTQPKRMPVWERKFGKDKREDNGDTLWVYLEAPSRNAQDLLKISASAGSTYETAVFITPPKP